METATPKKAIAEMSADTSLLISEISRKQPGDVLTFDWFREVIGWDIRDKRGILDTVKKHLIDDYDFVLSSIRNEGYRILKNDETIGELSHDRKGRLRSAKRSKRKASTVNTNNLNGTQRVQFFGEAACTQVTIAASEQKTIRRLASNNGVGEMLSLNHALEAIKKNL